MAGLPLPPPASLLPANQKGPLMPNLFTLDSIREESDKQFAPMQVGLKDGSVVSLRSLLRLNKKTRESVLSLLNELSPGKPEEGEEKPEADEESGLEQIDRLVSSIEKVLELVADDPKKLLKEIDGDFSVLKSVLESWIEETQAGEAQDSPA